MNEVAVIVKAKFFPNTPDQRKSLKEKLKYLQYRDDRDHHIPQEAGLERWQDCGLGRSYGEIAASSLEYASNKVLAWDIVIAPDPDMMMALEAAERPTAMRQIVTELMEYWFESTRRRVPEYAYVVHDSLNQAGKPFTHAHVVMAGTMPAAAGRHRFHVTKSQLQRNQQHLDQYVKTLVPQPAQPEPPVLEPESQRKPKRKVS